MALWHQSQRHRHDVSGVRLVNVLVIASALSHFNDGTGHPMSDSAKSKTAAPLPDANETNRLGDAALRAAPNRHHKKRKSLKPKVRHTARYGYAAPLLLPLVD